MKPAIYLQQVFASVTNPLQHFQNIIFQFTVQLNIIIIILTLLLCVACCPVFIYLSPVNNARHVLSLLTVVCVVLNSYLVNRL